MKYIEIADFKFCRQEINELMHDRQIIFSGPLEDLLQAAEKRIRPKAIYTSVQMSFRGKDYVCFGDVKFSSRVLSVHLADRYQAYPYAITIGAELETWCQSIVDEKNKMVLGLLQEIPFLAIRKQVYEEIKIRERESYLVESRPGSLKDWGRSQIHGIWSLLGDLQKSIGIETLKDNTLKPVNSGGALIYASDGFYADCMLCDVKNCPMREADHLPDLYKEKYAY